LFDYRLLLLLLFNFIITALWKVEVIVLDSKRIFSGELFLVAASETEKAAKEGFKTLMVKEPEALTKFTTRENTCLKYLAVDCLATKEISHRMQVSDRTVRLIIEGLRTKLTCTTNTAITAKVHLSGWGKLL
jgi:DNA-binding NarL/FixJ family response regulator